MNSLIDDIHVDLSWKIDIDGCFICSHLFSFHYVNVFTSIHRETFSCVAIGWWAALLLIIYLSLPPAQPLYKTFIPQRLDSHSSTQPPLEGRLAAPHMWMCLSTCLLFCLSVCVSVCVFVSFVSCIKQEQGENKKRIKMMRCGIKYTTDLPQLYLIVSNISLLRYISLFI